MITNTQWRRLIKILGQGPWESPAEFIFNAFTKNPNIQTSPPQDFNSLSDAEYDVVMYYGISEISKIKSMPCNKPVNVEYVAENMPYIHPDASIKFTTDIEVAPDIRITPPAKKTRPIRGEYVSIWDRPLSAIENSLTAEDEDIQPLERSLPQDVHIEKPLLQNIHKSFFDLPTEDNESAPITNPAGLCTLSVEKSEKLLKALLDNYEVKTSQPEPEKKLTMEKNLAADAEKVIAALTKFKDDTPPDSQIE